MDFSLTPEQKELKSVVADFADQVVAPLAHTVDTTGRIPSEIIDKARDLNLFGIPFPKETGGWGAGYLGLVIAVEEIARVCASTAFVITGHIGPTEILSIYGSAEQKRKYLRPLVRGECLSAFAATEPGAGSDIGATATIAQETAEGWVINGHKIFVSNADRANFTVITAVTRGRGRLKERISTFWVPSGIPGFTIGSRYNKFGMRGVSNYEIFLDNCVLPRESLIGEEGSGYDQALDALSRTRLGAAALSVGIARVCLESSLSYAAKRVQFNRALSKFQAIRFKLADMAVDLELARLMTHKGAWMLDSGIPHRQEAAMAKLYASEIASRAANQAIQIHGGAAYTTDYSQERYLRDAKLMELAEGTSEILRLTIAKQLGC